MEYRLLTVAKEDFEKFLALQKQILDSVISDGVVSDVNDMLLLLRRSIQLPLHFELYVTDPSEDEVDFRRKVTETELEKVILGATYSPTTVMKCAFYYATASHDTKPFFFCSPGLEINSMLLGNIDVNLLDSFNRMKENGHYFTITDDEQEMYSNQLIPDIFTQTFLTKASELKHKLLELSELVDNLPQSPYLLIIQQLIF